ALLQAVLVTPEPVPAAEARVDRALVLRVLLRHRLLEDLAERHREALDRCDRAGTDWNATTSAAMTTALTVATGSSTFQPKGVRLGEVERRAARLRGAGDEEDEQADELRRREPDRLVLPVDDVDERQRPAHDHDAEDGERERDLVRDELRARPHRAEQRELRVRHPAADDEAVDPDRAEREHEDQRDRHV